MNARPLILAGWLAAALPAQESYVFGRVHVGPQRVLGPARLQIDAGKITAVAPVPQSERAAPSSGGTAVRIDGRDRTVTAGFVDLHAVLPPPADPVGLRERAFALTPELSAGDGYDPFDARWPHLLARGVTSLCLAPDDRSLVGGRAAFLKPGPDHLLPLDEAYLKICLTKAALDPERAPTSLLGAADLLREALGRAARTAPAQRSRSQAILASTLEGGLPVAIAARSRAEIARALELVENYHLHAFIVGGDEALPFASRLARDEVAVAFDGLGPDAPPRLRALPAQLHRAGVRVVFCGERPARESMPALRAAMFTAVRHGLPPEAALAAVTAVPAQILRLGDRIGSLYKGRDADLAIWDGEPWDLRAKLLAVVRDGKLGWRRSTKEARR